jgi:3-phosphoshikimate 1-carboxyvinyltransferase
MADLLVKPGRLSGSVEPPPSKSDAHRALIAAALAGDTGLVQGLPDAASDDIAATRRCLFALTQGQDHLDCGESGTTLRLLIPVAAAMGAAAARPVVFSGQGRLPLRPLNDYQAILAGHGISLAFPPAGSLPLCLSGQLSGGAFAVPGHISSQYLSGLLLALPLLADDSTIRLTSPLESAPYVDMTLRTLATFGIAVDRLPDGFRVAGRQAYRPAAYTVEKDYSQAAFWLTAAYAGSPLTVTGLSGDSVQGDKAILALLDDFRLGRDCYTIDASQIPDLVPVLAVAAALTPAETRIVKAGRLRLKESDRLAATENALSSIGARIRQDGDSLVIFGGTPLTGGTADSWADHRIAMALAIAALSTRDGVLIKRAEAVRKSYPDFFREFRRLGGDFDGLDLGPPSENQHLW